MSSSNEKSNFEDYCGYWQSYPNNTRTRRWFQQFDALKTGGPKPLSFCVKMITASIIVYHVAYYTYQFTAINSEHRQDLRHVMWLKRRLSFFSSFGIR